MIVTVEKWINPLNIPEDGLETSRERRQRGPVGVVEEVVVLKPRGKALKMNHAPGSLPDAAEKVLGALDGVVGHGREVHVLVHVVRSVLEVVEAVAKPGTEANVFGNGGGTGLDDFDVLGRLPDLVLVLHDGGTSGGRSGGGFFQRRVERAGVIFVLVIDNRTNRCRARFDVITGQESSGFR
jgi:hypothetical protein